METTDIEKMSELLQAFANINCEDIGGDKASGGEFPVYADEISIFFQLIARDYWTDLNYDPVTEEANVANEAYIAQAGLEQIKSMLTYCLRAERHADGAWQALIKSGSLSRIMQRLGEIRRQNS